MSGLFKDVKVRQTLAGVAHFAPSTTLREISFCQCDVAPVEGHGFGARISF